MMKVLWRFPVPTTELVPGPDIRLDGSNVLVSYEIVNEEKLRTRSVTLKFRDVRGVRLTMGDCRSPEMFSGTGALMDLGSTPWLRETLKNREGAMSYDELTGLVLFHALINTDDVPCVEVICSSFDVEELS